VSMFFWISRLILPCIFRIISHIHDACVCTHTHLILNTFLSVQTLQLVEYEFSRTRVHAYMKLHIPCNWWNMSFQGHVYMHTFNFEHFLICTDVAIGGI